MELKNQKIEITGYEFAYDDVKKYTMSEVSKIIGIGRTHLTKGLKELKIMNNDNSVPKEFEKVGLFTEYTIKYVIGTIPLTKASINGIYYIKDLVEKNKDLFSQKTHTKRKKRYCY